MPLHQYALEVPRAMLVVLPPVSEVLLQINCSVNLFVYCVFNKRFKEVFMARIKQVTQFLHIVSPSSKRIARRNEYVSNMLDVDGEQQNLSSHSVL